VAALVLLILAMSSCQKETSELTQNRTTDISIEEAKNWLSLGPSGIQPITLQHRNPGTPDWGSSQFFKFQDKSSILKVPLIGYNLPVGYRDILFQKDSNGIILGAIQEVRPVKAYLAAKGRDGDEDMRQFVTNGDFTGDIIIFDPFDNVPLRGRRFKDGLVTGDLKYRSQSLMLSDPTGTVDPPKNPLNPDDDGPAFEIDLPQVEVTAPGPRTPSTPGTNIPFPSEPVRPIPGGPVTPNNPIPIGGGGGGSTSSITGSNSVQTITVDIIDPCIKSAVDMATNKNLQNYIQSTFNSLFSGSEKFAVYIQNGIINKDVYGTAKTISKGNAYYDIEITLNDNLLKGASKEVIVATLYHEMIHGMFDANKIENNDPLSWNEKFQHQIISSSYVDKISAGLKEIFPGIDKDDANALAWEGLSGTLIWERWKTTDPKGFNDMLLRGDQFDKNHKKGTRCN
jgi:hypothetical protein